MKNRSFLFSLAMIALCLCIHPVANAEPTQTTQELEEALQNHISALGDLTNQDSIFWAMFQIGCLKQQLGYSKSEIEDCFLKCHKAFPNRPEPVYYLSRIYEERKESEAAYHLLKGQLPYLEERPKFSVGWIRDYGILFQLSVSAYYVGSIEESFSISRSLLKNHQLDKKWKIRTKKNLLYSYKKLFQATKPIDELPFHLLGDSRNQVISSLLNIAGWQSDVGASVAEIRKTYLLTNSYSPSLESVYSFANYLSSRRIDQEAYRTALKGIQLPKATEDEIIYPWIHNYGMLWLFGITSYRVGEYEASIAVLESLLENDAFPDQLKNRLERHLFLPKASFGILNYAKEKWGLPPWEEV